MADPLGEVGLLHPHVATERPVPADDWERKAMQAIHLRAATRHLAHARAELDLLHLDPAGRPEGFRSRRRCRLVALTGRQASFDGLGAAARA